MPKDDSNMKDFHDPAYAALKWIPMKARLQGKTYMCSRWRRIKWTSKDISKTEETKNGTLSRLDLE